MTYVCTCTITRLFGCVILIGCVIYFMVIYRQVMDLPVIRYQNSKKVVSTKLKSDVQNVTNSSVDHSVNIRPCHLPHLDPYGPAVKRFIKVQKHHNCQHWNLITYQKEFKIIVNKTVIEKHYQMFSKCSYQPYVKEIGSKSGTVFLRHKFLNFTEFIEVTDEFCMITCYDTNDTVLTQQHFAVVIRNETLIKLRHQVRSSNNGANLAAKRRMNVVMIVLEATSRLNFIRHMNFTKSFLHETMSAVELLKYNKAGLNTFPNIILMLLGFAAGEIPGFIDLYPFIWKDFMKAGYVTLMGQDSSFDYFTGGFKWPPVDYFMRPFTMGVQEVNNKDFLCSGNSLVLQSLLDKLTDFITTYHDVPKFTFTVISNPSHDDHNGLGIVDIPLTRTLTGLNTRGLLDNTVLMVFGDHGMRFEPMRNTHQGRIEEHLPAFYVSLPNWFRKEHDDLYENLKANVNKLTSNVDVYATLQDILELGRGEMTPRVSGKYGTSLLRDISTNRTCDDLQIPSNFCMCQSVVQTYSNESKIVRDISHRVVLQINAILINVSHLCSYLTLNRIHHAWKSVNKTQDFIIQFSVLPSNAVFEATVRHSEQHIVLIGDILRTNKYRGQSDCVSRHEKAVVLERYCYCRE